MKILITVLIIIFFTMVFALLKVGSDEDDFWARVKRRMNGRNGDPK